MSSEIIDTLTDYARKFMDVYYWVDRYVEDNEVSKSILDKECNEEEWDEIVDFLDFVEEPFEKELNESVFVSGRDTQEYFYLGKIEEFLRVFHKVDDVSADIQIGYLKKNVFNKKNKSSIKISNVLSYASYAIEKLDDIRTLISEHYRHSLILSNYSTRFPILKSFVDYQNSVDDIGQSEKKNSRTDDEDIIDYSRSSKLVWKSSPAITGYIISELIRAGYVEPPTTNGELSFAKLAGICNQIFDIHSKGKPTTLDYLKKVVNPESNPLPDSKRAKLRLPDLDQLT